MANTTERKGPGLGVFLGVFTPTMLTILGVIMFMRVGWLVGVAGIGGALAIVALANVITFLTAMSVSALATNMRVGVGGAYFIISRSLGLEVGGAVGIPLYLSQVLSVTLYCYGLAESLRVVWEGVPVPQVAGLLVIFVTAVASRSTELTLKLQLPVMVLIAAAIMSLFLGASWGSANVATWGPFTDDLGHVGFWGAFAVFFPAVTGILAGVSLSGDLEDPAESIPKGVLASVAVGAVVYMMVPIALASSAPREALLNDSLIWTQIAAVPLLVMPGLWGAILSSAFGSVLGAPRTLQALATDEVVPKQLGAADPETGDPTVGLYLSGVLALIAVFLGDLNTVAEWVTIFFLTTYGALNTVAVVEVLVDDPSYRPRISTPWWGAALGAIGCFVAMFAINPRACMVAISVECVIFFLLRRRAFETEFGDARSGLILSLAHLLVRLYTDARQDPRNWRPTMLVLTRDLVRDLAAVRMASSFGDHRGMLSVVNIEERPLAELPHPDTVLPPKRAFLREHGIEAFCELTAVPEVDDATIAAICQAHGFGAMNANTILFPWDGHDRSALARILHHAHYLARIDRCTLVYRSEMGVRETTHYGRRPLVVIWWKGLESNGDLMLLLANLLSRNDQYRGANIRLRTVVDTQAEADAWRAIANELIGRIRMDVTADAVVRAAGETVVEVIQRSSADARLVFLGLTDADSGQEDAVAERMAQMVEGMPDTLFVRNAGPFRGRLV